MMLVLDESRGRRDVAAMMTLTGINTRSGVQKEQKPVFETRQGCLAGVEIMIKK